MSGYIDTYKWDLSPAVQALKSRMEDRKNQRENDLSIFNSVAKLMGNVADSAYKSMEQNKAEIDQLMAADDGISEEELLARYPQQEAYITSLFKKDQEEEEANEHRRWAQEENGFAKPWLVTRGLLVGGSND